MQVNWRPPARDDKDRPMPRILVLTEPVQKPDDGVMLDEHIAVSDLASDHFATQLIERIGWALADAESTEHHAAGALV
jgi:hypothetical protein